MSLSSVSPERKLEIVRQETTLAATVGVAFGKNNDVMAEAADAVVLDSSLERLDELMHIGRRMRRIALLPTHDRLPLTGCFAAEMSGSSSR
ncbi:MAG: hypothetical protein WCP95_16050 [Actinomycetes bacterium]